MYNLRPVFLLTLFMCHDVNVWLQALALGSFSFIAGIMAELNESVESQCCSLATHRYSNCSREGWRGFHDLLTILETCSFIMMPFILRETICSREVDR